MSLFENGNQVVLRAPQFIDGSALGVNVCAIIGVALFKPHKQGCVQHPHAKAAHPSPFARVQGPLRQ